MKKIAIYGKGGIGKSTTTANLAAACADAGLTVMQIGCDPKSDSTSTLLHGRKYPTVLDRIRAGNENPQLEDLVHEGYGGVLCVEAGGPTPGIGCAGRGIITAFEALERLDAERAYRPDVMLYDVLGDVVCGGFAVPMRRQYADVVYIVTSGEKMSLYAARNIASAIGGFKTRGYAQLGGIILNRRGVIDEYERVEALARELDCPIVADIPRSDHITLAEDREMTAVEAFPDSDISGLYRKLANYVLSDAAIPRIPSAAEPAACPQGDASCAAGPGLTYYLPAPAKKHTVLHIPGSHTLYVGPNSCMRRHYVHASEYGDKRHVSFLAIDQGDVVSGHYEKLMVESIGQLIELLDPTPRIFLLAVFCIDDFLGTDEGTMLALLERTYPNQQFAIEHIDPVSLSETEHMGKRKHRNLYSFVKPVPDSQRDRGINFLGNFVSVDEDCELHQLLKIWDSGPIRELFTCENYEDYQAMGRSCLSCVMRIQAEPAAQSLHERLGIPYLVLTPGYSADAVANSYRRLATALGCSAPTVVDEWAARAWEDARETVRLLDGMPVAIDSTASLACYDAARALIGYGFNVRIIFKSSHGFKLDPEAEAWIRDNCPQVTVTFAKSAESLSSDLRDLLLGIAPCAECSSCSPGAAGPLSAGTPSAADTSTPVLAIGADGARVLKARYYVDVWHDEGFFGFHGIHKLMAAIRKSLEHPVDWSSTPELNLRKGR